MSSVPPGSNFENLRPFQNLDGDTVKSQFSHMYSPSGTGLGPTMDINALRDDARTGPRNATEDNVPHRFELFLLGDGEKKVTEEADTRESIPKIQPFTLHSIYHSLQRENGNSLLHFLLQ